MNDEDESIELLIASIDAQFELGAAGHIWVRPGMTVAELQEQLDDLGMRRVVLRAARIAPFEGTDIFFVITVEGEQVFDDAEAAYAWTPASARRHETEGATSFISARFDDHGLSFGYVDYVLDAGELASKGVLALDDGPGVLAILVPELEAVLPLTDHSVISWRSRFDGSDNELQIRDGVAYRETMARYGDYYSSKPLDPKRVEYDIARIHTFLRGIASGAKVHASDWHSWKGPR